MEQAGEYAVRRRELVGGQEGLDGVDGIHQRVRADAREGAAHEIAGISQPTSHLVLMQPGVERLKQAPEFVEKKEFESGARRNAQAVGEISAEEPRNAFFFENFGQERRSSIRNESQHTLSGW